MKIPENVLDKLKIKDVLKLGQDIENAKPPPISVKFSHPTQRNSAISYSKNLKKELGVDKSVPKSYRDTYKYFNKEAWKLKNLHGYQTQVIFMEHKLILRYKLKDEGSNKYDFTIFKEWKGPEAGAQVPGPRVPQNNLGRTPTPMMDLSRNSETNRSIFLTKVKSDLSTHETTAKLNEHFSQVSDTIDRIDSRPKGIFIIICKSWDDCKNLVDKYKATKFNDQIPDLTMFSETDPALKPAI